MGDIAQVGFVVIYRWRLRPGREESFRAAWKRITVLLRRERGGLGSRLHRADDGTWIAYAQWPDRAAWEASRRAGPVDKGAMDAMGDAVLERFDPLPLDVENDMLAGRGASA